MKALLTPLLLAVLGFAALTAEKPAGTPFVKPSVATNGMWIWADGGFIYNGTNSVITYSNNVRVVDPQMFLQCELLTAFYNTNSSRLEVIVAEHKVMLVSRDRQILGDRAVYTSSNDTVVVTGETVALLDSRATLLGSQFVFDRKSGTAYSVGPVTTLLETTGGFSPTEALNPRPGPNQQPPGSKTASPGKN
jgi:lipopolysaccharide export system protein LptA